MKDIPDITNKNGDPEAKVVQKEKEAHIDWKRGIDPTCSK